MFKRIERYQCFGKLSRGLAGNFFLVAIVLLLSPWALFSQNKKQLELEIEALQKRKETLELQYWRFKEQSLEQRRAISENLSIQDEDLQLLYDNRNSFSEDIFLARDTLERVKGKFDEVKLSENALKSKISSVIEAEAEAIKIGFPSEVQENITELNRLRASQGFSAESGLLASEFRTLVGRLFAYKQNLVKRSEEIERYKTKTLNPETKVAEEVKALRVGFLIALFSGDAFNGVLLRQAGFNAASYEWESALPNEVTEQVSKAVSEAYLPISGKPKLILRIPIDPLSLGSRARVFLDGSRLNLVQAFKGYFLSGGFMMYPLAILAIFSVIIVLERLLYYRRNSVRKLGHGNAAIKFLREREFDKAKEIIFAKHDFIYTVLHPFFLGDKKTTRALFKADEAEQLIGHAMTSVSSNLERRLSTLAVLGAVAPLLGLLGTVSGMIALFDVITLFGTSNPKVLAGGISIALVTTQTGLSLAVPIIIFHHFLGSRRERILNFLERISLEAIEIFESETAKNPLEAKNLPDEKTGHAEGEITPHEHGLGPIQEIARNSVS